jgi:uncharacterized protein
MTVEILTIALAAFGAALLTLWSGFGLGTLLMPVVALFFSLDVAIAITGVVHLANNGFKVALIGAQAVPGVVFRFGIPALLAALMGAVVLTWLGDLSPLWVYQWWGREMMIEPVKLLVGGLILSFVVIEQSEVFSKLRFETKWLPFGGMLSGFFGGLSGHQGAFRSLFLLKAGLSKEQFVATGVVIAVMVDLARLVIYGFHFSGGERDWSGGLVAVACGAAFVGSFVGTRLLQKITMSTVQRVVSVLLVGVGIGLITGWF